MMSIKILSPKKWQRAQKRLEHMSQGHWCYRAASVNDASAVLAIYQESISPYTNEPIGKDFTVGGMAVFIQNYINQGDTMWVLEIQDTIVAWITLTPFSANTQTAEPTAFIRQTWRGRGLATHIGHFIIIQAKKRGFNSLMAWVLAHNKKSQHAVLAGKGQFLGTVPKLITMAKHDPIDVHIYHMDLNDINITESLYPFTSMNTTTPSIQKREAA